MAKVIGLKIKGVCCFHFFWRRGTGGIGKGERGEKGRREKSRPRVGKKAPGRVLTSLDNNFTLGWKKEKSFG